MSQFPDEPVDPRDPAHRQPAGRTDDQVEVEVEVDVVEFLEPDAVLHPFTMPDDGEGSDWVDGDEAEDPIAALLGAGGGAGGGLDLGSLMEQAAAMQSQLMAAQAEAAETVVEGAAGGGAVKISVTGGWQFQSVTIDPSAVDPDDVEMLQDLVLAALHHAAEQVTQLQAGAVDLSGLGLPDLFGGG